MPRVVITHEVADVERWLAGKADRANAIQRVGSNVVDHVALDGSKRVAISVDVSDMAGLQAMLASPPPDVAAKMAEHGVVPPVAVYVQK